MKMQTAVDETSEKLHSKRAALRIQRYFMLICFAAYLRTLVTKEFVHSLRFDDCFAPSERPSLHMQQR